MFKNLLHLLAPQHSNNHRSRILHPAGLALLIGIFIVSHASLGYISAHDQQLVRGNILGYSSNITTQQVIDATNVVRKDHNLSSLSHNSTLSLAAQAKALDMFAFDYWAHDNPSNGKQPWAFIREAGYTYRFAGENLARDFGETPDMITAWMNSPTHRDNIISNRYTEIGTAVVNGELQGIETTLVVQMFAAPATQQAVASSSTPDSIIPQAVASTTLESSSPSLIPPITVSKTISLSILLLLAIALIIDYLIVSKNGTVRVTGKNLAHLSLIGILIIIVLISSPGGIL